jgi:hypothetical protein
MQEIFTSMEFRKFLSEDLVVGTDKITYLGYADYAANPIITDKRFTYRTAADKANPIRRIKKIVENTVTKITETYYPE